MTPMKDNICDKLPCSQHMAIFGGIAGTFTLAMTILIGNVIANENRRKEADDVLYKAVVQNREDRMSAVSNIKEEQQRAYQELLRDMNAGFMEIKQRLVKIESKI